MASDLIFLSASGITLHSNASSNMVKDYILPLIPSILTIIGWIVIARLETSKKIDERANAEQTREKELFERRLLKILDQIDNLHTLSKEYYKHLGSDPIVLELNQTIPVRLKQLNHFITRAFCKNNSPLEPKLTKAYIDYKRAITGGDFASGSRQIYPLNHIKYSDISKYYINLYIEIESLLQ